MEQNLPLEEAAKECHIVDTADAKDSVNRIVALSKTYTNDELILFYNYFFENTNNYDILMFLLGKIDKYRDKSSLPILIDTFLMKDKLQNRINNSDQITRIRINITKALANTKNSQAVYPLLYCLNSKDENYKVKLSCAEALGKIGDKYAVLPLMNVIEDENESSVYVKESAISALGMLGDEKAIEPLVTILESKKGLLDRFTFLKERALEALNKLNFKGERVFKALEKSLLDESAQVRINAIEALMNSGDDRALPLIKKMLNDSNGDVVQNAVIALYNLEGDDILDEIINDSSMPDEARQEAIKLKDDLQEEDFDSETGDYDE